MASSTVISCRGCMSEVKPTGFYSFQWAEIRDLFVECTSVPVEPNEQGLPQQICSECYSKCENWHQFKSMCMEVNKHLLESKKPPDLPPMVVVKQELEPLDGTSDVDELNFGELIQDSPPEAFRSPNDEQTRNSNDGDQDESDDIKCPVCQKDVANLEGLQEHLREHCSDESPKCPICHWIFDRASKIYPHVLSVHMKRTEHEQVKQEESDEEDTLDGQDDEMDGSSSIQGQKRKRNSGQGPFRCPHCPKVYNFHRRYLNHLIVHTKERRPYKCKLCPQTFRWPSQYSQHTLKGHKEKVKNPNLKDCPLCEDKVVQIWSHLIYKHVEKKDKMCPICHVEQPNRNQLAGHLRQHTKEEQVNCPMCWERFLNEDVLKKHFVKHTKESPYECKWCTTTSTKEHRILQHVTEEHPGKLPSESVRIKEDSIFRHPRPWELMGYTLNKTKSASKKAADGERNDQSMADESMITDDSKINETREGESSGEDTGIGGSEDLSKVTSPSKRRKSRKDALKDLLNCHKCDRPFLNPRNLAVHIQRSHKSCELPFFCRVCEKNFAGPKWYWKHLERHLRAK